MTEDWNIFERNTERERMSLFLNTGLKQNDPPNGYTMLLSLTVNLYRALGNQTIGAIYEQVYKLEDRLESLMSRQENKDRLGIYVGRLMTSSKVELFYYMKDGSEYKHELETLIKAYDQFNFTYAERPDANWSFYTDYLYPTPLEQLYMRNARLFYGLRQNGYKLDVVRPVHHVLYFDGRESMDVCKQKAIAHGFKVELTENVTEMGKGHKLVVSKRVVLDMGALNGMVRELFELAEAHGGNYDGWGTDASRRFTVRLRLAMRNPRLIVAAFAVIILAAATWELLSFNK
ncbi:DUF695 domain-containing protein [Paenibacillus sp. MBLB4367]|uniref:DUF695 domain-containing protein n=1 Tax=Paenibacillus sp. MBLB4367 TaxID=3384767 RepID=UPI00390822E6